MTRLIHPIGSPGPIPKTRWIGEFPCCADLEFYSDLPREEAFAVHIRHRHPEVARERYFVPPQSGVLERGGK